MENVFEELQTTWQTKEVSILDVTNQVFQGFVDRDISFYGASIFSWLWEGKKLTEPKRERNSVENFIVVLTN